MPDVAQALAANGLDAQEVQILGTGLWNDPRVLALPALQGAWFAAPDNSGFTAFAARYRAKYSSDPARIATLSYDAVSLAVALAHRPGPDRFSDAILTNHAGFNGADGVFRFRSNGLNDRALAIMEINGNTAVPSRRRRACWRPRRPERRLQRLVLRALRTARSTDSARRRRG